MRGLRGEKFKLSKLNLNWGRLSGPIIEKIHEELKVGVLKINIAKCNGFSKIKFWIENLLYRDEVRFVVNFDKSTSVYKFLKLKLIKLRDSNGLNRRKFEKGELLDTVGDPLFALK